MHVITIRVDEPVAVFDTPHLDVYARNALRDRLVDELRATLGGEDVGVDIIPQEESSADLYPTDCDNEDKAT